jgi:hypothetical protein
VASVGPDQSFKGRQFNAEVILWEVRWYLMFPVSYRDLCQSALNWDPRSARKRGSDAISMAVIGLLL